MKTLITSCLISLLASYAAMAQGGIDLAEKVRFSAIKSIQYNRRNNSFEAEVQIIFENSSDRNIRIRNGNFAVGVKRTKASPLWPVPPETVPVEEELGKGTIEQVVLPAAGGKANSTESPAAGALSEGKNISQTKVTMRITLGRESEPTLERLMRVNNILGDPDSGLRMTLRGEAEFGAQTPNGWISHKNVSVELEFKPRVTNEVLIE
jgi:hypothetical protein